MVITSACSSDSPTAPSPATQRAAVSIVSFTVETGTIPDGFRYTTRITIRETSGSTGATIQRIDLTFFAGSEELAVIAYDDPMVSPRVAPGGTLESKDLLADDNPPATLSTRIMASVV